MELFFVLMGLVGVFFLVNRTGKVEKDSPQPPPSQRQKTAYPKAASGKAPDVQASRFDATTATRSPQKTVLHGAAWVTDGDTIKIKNTQIRLFGIDAPELNHPFGKKAKWALHRLCKGQVIRAEVTEIDHYGRTVARCYLSDGRDLSAEMVKQGLAIDWAKFSGGVYRKHETQDARRKLFLADARQQGRMHVWDAYEQRQAGE